LRPGSSCNAKVRARNVVALSSLSCALGVGSDDEDTCPTVGSAGIGSSNAQPARVVPERGQVSEYLSESERKVACDVLQQDVSRSYQANSVPDAGPEVSLIVCSCSLACVAERLARIPRREPVHGLDLRPVGVLHVAVVGDAGEAVREDRGRVLVVLDVPGVLDRADGEFQS
jgi:hypothetical protein